MTTSPAFPPKLKIQHAACIVFTTLGSVRLGETGMLFQISLQGSVEERENPKMVV